MDIQASQNAEENSGVSHGSPYGTMSETTPSSQAPPMSDAQPPLVSEPRQSQPTSSRSEPERLGESAPPEVQIVRPSHQRPETPEPPQNETDRGELLDDRGPDYEGIDTDRLLVFGAKQIIRLFVPVSLCMIFVVVVIYSISYYTRIDGYLPYTPFHTEGADTGTKLWQSLTNALIFIGIIIVITTLIVLLYKYRCYKLIYGWLVVTSLLLLFFFCFIFFRALLFTWDMFVDTISFSIFIWNFGIVGMMTLYWKAPLLLQQGYLLLVSAQMALFFIKYFPSWTAWFLLGFLAVWDLIAVLCPKGPLRMLVEMAVERQETLMPAMIYSTTAVWALMADADRPTAARQEDDDGGFENHASNESRAERLRNHHLENPAASGRARAAVSALNGDSDTEASRMRLPEGQEDSIRSRTARNLRDIQDEVLSREDRGVKLGLGDFVFYSVLVGKASTLGDWNTTLACYVAILIGMCFTILLLAIRGHALPALPISIFFGLIFYFCTSLLITPFSSILSDNQVFV